MLNAKYVLIYLAFFSSLTMAHNSFTSAEKQSVNFAMKWCDQIRDPENNFLSFGEDHQGGHWVRESVWYATGLLQRHKPKDIEAALPILSWTAEHQFLRAGDVAYGSFPELMESPIPPPKAKMWEMYDPNWRQFIGTNFIVLLEDFKADIPQALQEKMLHTLLPAIKGEKQEKRLEPGYSNIALMHAFLLNWTGHALKQPELEKEGEDFAKEVYDIFKKNNAFLEYNSPTYYGVDLYALALWRTRAASEKMRAWGAEMEELLWKDTVRFYSPGLKNLSGPFTRSYGMDMQKYANLMGLYLLQILGAKQAPFPTPQGELNHALDLPWAPVFVQVGTKIPDSALHQFQKFSGPHLVTKKIRDNPTHVATAWVENHLLIGGETSERTKAAGEQHGQYLPATIHWRLGKDVGWIKLVESPKVDAVAEKDILKIQSDTGTYHFRIYAPGTALSDLSLQKWNFPGLKLKLSTDAKKISSRASTDGLDVFLMDASYAEFTRVKK